MKNTVIEFGDRRRNVDTCQRAASSEQILFHPGECTRRRNRNTCQRLAFVESLFPDIVNGSGNLNMHQRAASSENPASDDGDRRRNLDRLQRVAIFESTVCNLNRAVWNDDVTVRVRLNHTALHGPLTTCLAMGKLHSEEGEAAQPKPGPHCWVGGRDDRECSVKIAVVGVGVGGGGGLVAWRWRWLCGGGCGCKIEVGWVVVAVVVGGKGGLNINIGEDKNSFDNNLQ